MHRWAPDIVFRDDAIERFGLSTPQLSAVGTVRTRDVVQVIPLNEGLVLRPDGLPNSCGAASTTRVVAPNVCATDVGMARFALT